MDSLLFPQAYVILHYGVNSIKDFDEEITDIALVAHIERTGIIANHLNSNKRGVRNPLIYRL